MARNIVTLLQKRQMGQCESGELCQLFSSLNTSHISLAQIMDRDRQLLEGHVILGFSRSGNHMISYQYEIDGDATSYSQHKYTLHWWWFDLHKPLRHVRCCDLFRGEVLYRELHLLVCQTPDESHVVVVGCRRSCVGEDRRSCYVTILPSPPSPPSILTPTLADNFSLHFKFDLLAPFPAFIPSLSLKIPGCVIVNTGDSLVALRYSVQSRVGQTQSSDTTPPAEVGKLHHSSHILQEFAQCSDASSSMPVCSPTHLLPVDVYCCDHALIDVSRSPEKTVECVVVCQSSLDVELWVNGALQSELDSRGFTFHSLTDYDLQLVEVCGERGDVVFLIVVMVEASGPSPSVIDFYTVDITASWNVYSGQAKALHFSQLKPSPVVMNLGSHNRWNPAAPLALSLRKHWQLPTSTQNCIRAFSNHTVFTGKSLHSLHHPYLPVSVVLSSNRTGVRILPSVNPS